MQVIIVLFTIVFVLLIYSLIETRWLKNTVYHIVSSKIPPDIDGKRIVLLSDLHTTTYGTGNTKLFRMIEGLKPDRILIAGDVINGNTSKKQFIYASELFCRLNKLNVPVYYSFGNHECRLRGFKDNYGDFKDYLELSEKFVTVLNNRSVPFDNTDSAVVTGLMLPQEQFKRKTGLKLNKPLSELLGKADESSFNILIAHDPYYFNEYMEWGADLVVSGHIHGGIIRLPFIGGLISPRFELFPRIDKGLYRYDDDRLMIVSGGIGWHGLPFRFLNRPEVVTIDLERRK